MSNLFSRLKRILKRRWESKSKRAASSDGPPAASKPDPIIFPDSRTLLEDLGWTRVLLRSRLLVRVNTGGTIGFSPGFRMWQTCRYDAVKERGRGAIIGITMDSFDQGAEGYRLQCKKVIVAYKPPKSDASAPPHTWLVNREGLPVKLRPGDLIRLESDGCSVIPSESLKWFEVVEGQVQ